MVYPKCRIYTTGARLVGAFFWTGDCFIAVGDPPTGTYLLELRSEVSASRSRFLKQ